MISVTTEKSFDITLRELVMQARGGNQVAYKKLLKDVAPVIRRTVSARLGRGGQQTYVEDITQDALLALHLKLHTYDSDLPFLAWVHAVAKHKMIDHIRRMKGANISIDDDSVPEIVDTANPEAPTIALDLEKLLKQLKPPAGEIIYGLKVEGASIRDLAKAYHVTEANIKVIVHRGLQKLSQLVRQE